MRQGLGVGMFRRIYGGRSNVKGSVDPEHFAKAAGGVIRHALHNLETLGLVEKNPGAKGGRRWGAGGWAGAGCRAGGRPCDGRGQRQHS